MAPCALNGAPTRTGPPVKRSFETIFIRVFPLTGMLFGALTYYLLNLQMLGERGTLLAVMMGFTCGMVFGVATGYFVRSDLYEFEVDPSVDIFTRLQLQLINMGYRLEHQFKKVITFQPGFRAGIFADRIRVEFIQGTVRIEGPALHLEKIRATLGV